MADLDAGLFSGLFRNNGSGGDVDEWCYDYNHCHFRYVSGSIVYLQGSSACSVLCTNYILCIQQKACPEADVHQNVRYTEGSAAWVLIASIIVFFMVDGKKMFIKYENDMVAGLFLESRIYASRGCFCQNS